MTVFFLFFVGAFLNRVRGGLFDKRKGIFWTYVKKVKKIVQPIMFGLITWNPLAGAAMWLGQSPGWGLYIGALGGFNGPGKEQVWIDCIIRPLEIKPRLWGGAGLFLRGLTWGIPIGCALLSFKPVIAGAAMPLFYWPVMEISKFLQKKYGRDVIQAEAGWGWAEWPFGGFLWSLSLASM